MADLVKEFEERIEAITLIPSDSGRFEVEVDGKLAYSKLQTGRHAEPGEVLSLVKRFGKGG
jgi:selenoprotein W-related protein